MLKKTITYTNFEGEQETKDFYFNLTKSDLAELEYSIPGGFDSIRREITSQLSEGRVIIGALLDAYKIIIAKAIGKRSTDGKRFKKTDEFRDEFMASDAYSELVLELMNVENEDKITEFFSKVVVGMPDNVKDEVERETEKLRGQVLSSNGVAVADNVDVAVK